MLSLPRRLNGSEPAAPPGAVEPLWDHIQVFQSQASTHDPGPHGRAAPNVLVQCYAIISCEFKKKEKKNLTEQKQNKKSNKSMLSVFTSNTRFHVRGRDVVQLAVNVSLPCSVFVSPPEVYSAVHSALWPHACDPSPSRTPPGPRPPGPTHPSKKTKRRGKNTHL